MPDTTFTSPWRVKRGQRVRIVTTGEITTVVELTGESDRPRLALAAREEGGGLRFYAPDEVEAATFDPADETLEPDPETTPLEALAALAVDLEHEGLTEYARRARILAARMGHLVDEVRACATMLTGYGPGVNDRAVVIGEGALREIGDLR